MARDPAGMRADLDRFRSELGTDYLDVCLMHCVTEADWTDRFRGVWTSSPKPRRREPSAPMAAPAIPSKPCVPPQKARG